jgi:hypothetical protein
VSSELEDGQNNETKPEIDSKKEAAIRRLTDDKNNRIAELAQAAVDNIDRMREKTDD